MLRHFTYFIVLVCVTLVSSMVLADDYEAGECAQKVADTCVTPKLLSFDPHLGFETWLSPSPLQQLKKDKTIPRVNLGGIFVPTMTDGAREPNVEIYDQDKQLVESTSPGEVAYVRPGTYTVYVGTGSLEDRLAFETVVEPYEITPVPVEWSGLVIRVLNDRGTPIRGAYEILRLPDRAYVGYGLGAVISDGERLNTWLLWPGRYMIISAGEGYQARKNYLTIELKPGRLSLMTLVLDEKTGDIHGGGEVDETQRTKQEDEWWDINLITGGSISFNSSTNYIGKYNGMLLNLSGFLEFNSNILLDGHFFYGRLNAEIGGDIRFEEDRPFTTTVDTLRLELLYAYRVTEWFGPYVRTTLETNMAPTYQSFDAPYIVSRYEKDGTLESTSNPTLDTKISPPFSPIELSAGTGARFDFQVGHWLRTNTRVGVAYREFFIRELYVVTSTSASDRTARLDAVKGSRDYGLEFALFAEVTPWYWVTLKVDFSALTPFDDFKNPIIDLLTALSIRISSIANLAYTFRLKYEPMLLKEVQLDHLLQLRFSYSFF